MDTVTIIRVVSGVLFVVVLFILIQRRKGGATRGQ
jgi:preprotein translocase subunit SecG